MSSSNPPYPYYNGIPYNPSYFSTGTGSDSGLTQTLANTLYLRKTVPDTATSQETFNAGIKTNAIDGTATNSAITIGTSLVTAGSVSVGSSSATVNIKNDPSTGGAVNIMNGSLTGGNINLGKYTSTPFPTWTNTTIDGAVDIGNAATTTNISGSTLTINGPLTLGYTSYSSSTSVLGGFQTNRCASGPYNLNTGGIIFMPINNIEAGLYSASINIKTVGVVQTPFITAGLLGSSTALTQGTLVSAITPVPVYPNFDNLGLQYDGYVNTVTAGYKTNVNLSGCFISSSTNKNIAVYIRLNDTVTVYGVITIFRIG